MKVLNLNHESLKEILPRVQKKYPNAVIKKPLVELETMQIQHANILFIIMKKRTDFVVDFDCSKSRASSVMFAFGALGRFIARAIFKSRNKGKIEQFNSDFANIINDIGNEKLEMSKFEKDVTIIENNTL